MNAKNIKNGIPKVGQETLNNNADMIERIMSVSYTHLDVYKRQLLAALTISLLVSMALNLA